MRGILADEIGTRRERLAELDRRGADRLEGGGIVGGLGLDRAEPRDAAEALDSRRRLRRGFDPAQSAVACEDAAPFQQPDDMGDGPGHSTSPSRLREGLGEGMRSEERRGGKEGVSTCRSGWWRYI